jgi:hypothetical protein
VEKGKFAAVGREIVGREVVVCIVVRRRAERVGIRVERVGIRVERVGTVVERVDTLVERVGMLVEVEAQQTVESRRTDL